MGAEPQPPKLQSFINPPVAARPRTDDTSCFGCLRPPATPPSFDTPRESSPKALFVSPPPEAEPGKGIVGITGMIWVLGRR